MLQSLLSLNGFDVRGWPRCPDRIRQQEAVAELGQQALETDDLDQLMYDASVAVAEALDDEMTV